MPCLLINSSMFDNFWTGKNSHWTIMDKALLLLLILCTGFWDCGFKSAPHSSSLSSKNARVGVVSLESERWLNYFYFQFFSFNLFIWSFHLYISKILEKTNSNHVPYAALIDALHMSYCLSLTYKYSSSINYLILLLYIRYIHHCIS